MNGRLLFLLALALSVTPARAQENSEARFDSLANHGIDRVYNLEFESAEKEFAEMVGMRPLHPAGHFFLAMVDWWRIVVDMENEQYDRRFFGELDRVVEMCDSMLGLNANDVTAIFFKGGAIGFQGRLRFHRNDYLAAANAGRKALPLVQKASSLDPGNRDILLGTGIYNYYAAVIPDEYPFVKPLMLFVPPGDRRKGIEQLTEAAAKGRYARTEAAYFLMQICYFYEKDYPRSLALALDLNRQYPENMLFQRYLGRSYAALANWSSAERVFREIQAKVRRGQRGYTANVEREAEYYLGVAAMNAGELDSALTHLFRCDELCRSLDSGEASGFMALANLKAGNIYDLQSRRDLALVQYRKVLGLKEYQDSHGSARQFLLAPYAH